MTDVLRMRTDEGPQDLHHPSLYINRELSWLEFNRRVLHEAQDPRTPLLERCKFQANVFPVLTPLAVDPAHPFPYISNLSLSIAVTLRDDGGEERFARVKVPKILPRWVPLDQPNTFVPLEQVIGANLEALFPGIE